MLEGREVNGPNSLVWPVFDRSLRRCRYPWAIQELGASVSDMILGLNGGQVEAYTLVGVLRQRLGSASSLLGPDLVHPLQVHRDAITHRKSM